ncbi:MAG TPA: ABC transporter ATP-binding protein, partial [Spirochaetes bacterium]|nr:ABC transporter ATP-binding protein [Spirochaetota bacterium]
MGKIIEVVGLKKIYGDISAVNDVSFYLYRGEIFGFLGPNGAGKTSTINMLVGMAKPTEGKIFYNGEDFTNCIRRAREIIGIVPDDSNLYGEMSGYENLCFCGALYGMPKKKREPKAKELLDIFQLSDAANRKFQAYSKGMKRKLTIAAALMHDPEILFLDEPTTGIDVASVRQIRSLIKQLNKKGATIFLTTHYIEEAERLCDRVAFINRGSIVTIDTVAQLLENAKESNVLEISFENTPRDKQSMLEKLCGLSSGCTCGFLNENTIKIISDSKIDV